MIGSFLVWRLLQSGRGVNYILVVVLVPFLCLSWLHSCPGLCSILLTVRGLAVFSLQCGFSFGSAVMFLARFADLLVGLVVKASASRPEDPGFESRLRRDFFGVESYL